MQGDDGVGEGWIERLEKADLREVDIRKSTSMRQDEYDLETERREEGRGGNYKKTQHNCYF